jgi:hypothetical protein
VDQSKKVQDLIESGNFKNILDQFNSVNSPYNMPQGSDKPRTALASSRTSNYN